MEGLGFERFFGGSWRNKQRASVEFVTRQYGSENSEVLGINHLSVLRRLTGGTTAFESVEMRSLRDRRRR